MRIGVLVSTVSSGCEELSVDYNYKIQGRKLRIYAENLRFQYPKTKNCYRVPNGAFTPRRTLSPTLLKWHRVTFGVI